MPVTRDKGIDHGQRGGTSVADERAALDWIEQVDKPVTVRRERIGTIIGRLNAAEMARVNTAIALVMGLAD